MDKSSFRENTRYAIALKDDSGKLRPANIYVYKLHDDFLVARFTDRSGTLCKIAYTDVTKIVKTVEVDASARFVVPEILLSAKTWQGRTSMQAYGSSPRVGK
ncbi:hypothetical protein BI364_13825 [Acidihalobacter yilgarnensis]|uniref:WYL domain-containing protein n=1 Tax=Acidihalobacter yilgarnensis TaxID=2819280 RepID=A0A1D8ITE9_9GAMM|nr:hypothetical protein [Acidihalobacter yilgarnensis]AOU99746.1 hypothetical protein BI364_13825 [Acidihalobacter yilgarnensis]